MRRETSNAYSLARLVALALLIAAVCNGVSFYLKKTGVIDNEAYRAYWAIHCREDVDDPKDWVEYQCAAFTTPEEIARHTSPAPEVLERFSIRYVYDISSSELPLKFAKDIVVFGLIAISILMIARHTAAPPAFGKAWPISLLAGYTIIAFLVSLVLNGTLIAAAGARSFMFVVIALVGQWFVPHIGVFARCMGAFLILEVLLIPFELFFGIHLNEHLLFEHIRLPGQSASLALDTRASGTMVLPNSLGIFAVTSVAFCYSFSPKTSWLPLLSVVMVALVVFSGSWTGMVCAPMILFVIFRERISKDKRAFAIVAGIAIWVALFLAVVVLRKRGFSFDSILGDGGRQEVFIELVKRGLLETVFGSGFGVRTNAALNLSGLGGQNALRELGALTSGATDSAFIGLVLQLGMLGTLLFYGALFWAGLRDRVARLFYFIVALCTLTINITELFPTNVLVGIAWAHSAWVARSDDFRLRSEAKDFLQ